ncbi:MAG: lipoprotein-releasing ABC transporter permease subunit [Proteobacteria bacterium]|nr:lipoprotein-releasing ABC transporter permease subunit [Pseudomonadota bacterium]
MFQPLSLFIGLRYVRSRGRKFFISFITLVSLLGVGLGVAALIVVLSVMNGFEGELRARLLALSSHARVFVPAESGATSVDWTELATKVRAVPGVVGAAPVIELEALAVHTPEMVPIRLRGIDPLREADVTDVHKSIIAGRLSDLTPGADRVILGVGVAQLLSVGVGDSVTLLVPAVSASGAPEPKLREFTVTGLLEAGLQDHDSVLAIASLSDVASVVPHDGRAIGLQVQFTNALDAPRLAPLVAQVLPAGVELRDWTVEHANYFRAIRIEKTMMAIILMLIVAVAAFNLVAMLVMVVTDKRTDIAILRTLGTSPRRVMGVFLTQGLVIGWFGVGMGVLLGVLLARNAGAVSAWLERIFRFQFFNSDVYYITRIPSILDWSHVAWVAGIALTLTALATVYPAVRASRVPPAEALRYE